MNELQLAEQIEMLRRELYKTGKIHGMSSEVALAISQQLDQKIDEYHKLTHHQ